MEYVEPHAAITTNRKSINRVWDENLANDPFGVVVYRFSMGLTAASAEDAKCHGIRHWRPLDHERIWSRGTRIRFTHIDEIIYRVVFDYCDSIVIDDNGHMILCVLFSIIKIPRLRIQVI